MPNTTRYIAKIAKDAVRNQRIKNQTANNPNTAADTIPKPISCNMLGVTTPS